MDHATLVNLALGIHGTLLAASVVAFYKYGDRSELFQKSMQSTDETKRILSSSISNNLSASLETVFGDAGTSPSLLVGPDGSPADADYEEVPMNPVNSEMFREAVRGFVVVHASTLADYWRLRTSRDNWSFWAKWLSWGILCLLWWEAFVSAAILLDALDIVTWSDRQIRIGFAPTAAAFFGCLASLPFLLHRHDRIMSIRNRYDEL